MHLILANIFFFYRENICSPNIGMHSLYYSLYHIYLFKVKSNGWMQKKIPKKLELWESVWWSIITHAPLFRNKSFVPNEIFQRNNSKKFLILVSPYECSGLEK